MTYIHVQGPQALARATCADRHFLSSLSASLRNGHGWSGNLHIKYAGLNNSSGIRNDTPYTYTACMTNADERADAQLPHRNRPPCTSLHV